MVCFKRVSTTLRAKPHTLLTSDKGRLTRFMARMHLNYRVSQHLLRLCELLVVFTNQSSLEVNHPFAELASHAARAKGAEQPTP